MSPDAPATSDPLTTALAELLVAIARQKAAARQAEQSEAAECAQARPATAD